MNIIIGYFRQLAASIKSTWQWLPIIWEDRHWDYSFLERIMLVKLQRMYLTFTGAANIVDWSSSSEVKQSIKALRICIMILQRRADSFYTEQCYNNNDVMADSTDMQIWYQIEERDWQIFHQLYSKYMRYWWN